MTDTTIATDTPPETPASESDIAHYFQLDAAETKAWQMLEAGAKSYKKPFHTVTLATVTADGAPQARTVVLREADQKTRILRANTDLRAPKAQQLLHDSRAQLLFYDAAAKAQIRLTVRAEVLTEGAVRDGIWATTAPGSKVCYLAVDTPGTPRPQGTSGLPDFADGGQRVPADLLEAGAENFAVMRFHTRKLDWLYLDSAGHRRAIFDYEAGTSAWVIP